MYLTERGPLYLLLLLSFFLAKSRKLDVYHTSTRGVALVRI